MRYGASTCRTRHCWETRPAKRFAAARCRAEPLTAPTVDLVREWPVRSAANWSRQTNPKSKSNSNAVQCRPTSTVTFSMCAVWPRGNSSAPSYRPSVHSLLQDLPCGSLRHGVRWRSSFLRPELILESFLGYAVRLGPALLLFPTAWPACLSKEDWGKGRQPQASSS